MSTAHTLKTWPEHYQAVSSGRKTFEVRRDDRGFKQGDVLLLQEYDPDRDDLPAGKRFTGRELTADVLYVLHGGRFGIEPGYVVMSIKVLQRGSSRIPRQEG